MTKEEYTKRYNEIQKEKHAEIEKLAIEYAESNNPVKIGDVVTDRCQRIKVETIKAPLSVIEPHCVYSGPLLTKAGTPFKSGKRGRMSQYNLKMINGKPIWWS